MSAQIRIDPRGPRFGAAITAVLLLVTVFLGLVAPAATAFAERLAQPGFLLLVALSALFAWGAFAGIQRHPYGRVFAAVIRPRLAPPAETEDAAPPTFAQGVGFAVTFLGIVLHLLGVPLAVPVAAGAAFIAAFLNAVFGYCLGCQLYVLLLRVGVIRQRAAQS
ncbi:DUF4395 domain-containing protein [Pseudoclavibacter sp. AY1F1]|uniref:DUF4395 domain-containing protein n=1 Tax=Pseudoclavibacter sp. AY1F1 TaxID=2080583 RepID=UPI000CE8D70A|nr:DUF4395 domain-containing protein [Pseudoclavibacter sp. AY1F1]PPF42270.1 DUF4395 domain-containing protein [Pseudoclavibacter sp. AY1F1]